MMRRLYLKIESALKDAHHSFLLEQGNTVCDFDDHPSPVERMMLEDLIVILSIHDNATELFGKTKSPSVQNFELLTASIIATLSEIQVQNGYSARIAKILCDGILKRRRALFNEILIIEVVLRVATFFTPQYNSSFHQKYLKDTLAYSINIKCAAKILYKLASVFMSGREKTEEQSGCVSFAEGRRK